MSKIFIKEINFQNTEIIQERERNKFVRKIRMNTIL